MRVDTKVSMTAAADLLGVDADRLKQLVGDGYIRRNARGLVSLGQAVRGFTNALRDDAERSGKSAVVSRIQVARARAVELRNAEADGVVFDFVESQDIIGEAVGRIKAGLHAVPARLTRDLVVRRRIEEAIDHACNSISDHFQREADELEASMPGGSSAR